MPSTGAMIYLRPVASVGVSTSRSTGAMLSLALRSSTGQFTSGGRVKGSRDLRNKKTTLPDRSISFVGPDGKIADVWYSFLSYLHQTFLNMPNGPTLPDLANYVTFAQLGSVVSEQILAALSQQANTNAQAIQAITQVAQAAALPGATQIPPARLYKDYDPTGDGTTGI